MLFRRSRKLKEKKGASEKSRMKARDRREKTKAQREETKAQRQQQHATKKLAQEQAREQRKIQQQEQTAKRKYKELGNKQAINPRFARRLEASYR